MHIRRMTASVALAAILVGTSAMPALAERGGEHGPGSDKGRGHKVSEQFGDMGDFGWGLDDVIKMAVKGVFKGREDGVFAPGAKITHQEAAVAVVRMMDKESAAQALSAAEVDSLLAGVSDQKAIAVWARPAVAMLVKSGVIDKDSPFSPLDDATRLDVAVMLVNALGYKAEAQAKMSTQLHFKDAHLVPANLVGYVAVAVDHQLISGYDDQTFRPQQAVKRVEMAVMMGRADRLVDRDKQDEYKGTVKSVDAVHNSFVLSTGEKEVTLTLADEASIFVDKVEKDVADLKAGMSVEVKLNRDGQAIYIQAKTEVSSADPVVNGQVTALVAATTTSLALVSIGNVAYPLSPKAVITLNGQAATYADLRVGDTVKATTTLGLVVKLEAQRAVTVTTVSGTVTGVTAATSSALAKVSLSVTANGTTATTDYPVAANAVVTLGGQASALTALRATDVAALTLGNGVVTKIEAQRAVTSLNGTVAAVAAATASAPAKITVVTSVDGTARTTEYTLASGALFKLNGQVAQFADVHVGDAVTLTLGAGLVDKVELTRVVPQTTVIEGSLVSVAVVAGQNVPAGTVGQVSIGYIKDGSFTMVSFSVLAATQLNVNGQGAQFADLHPGDAVKATLVGDVLTKLEVTR